MLLVLLSLGKFFFKEGFKGFLMFERWNGDFMGWYFGSVSHPTMLATVVSTRMCLSLFNMSDGHWWFLSSFHCESPDLQINLLAKKTVDGEILTHCAALDRSPSLYAAGVPTVLEMLIPIFLGTGCNQPDRQICFHFGDLKYSYV